MHNSYVATPLLVKQAIPAAKLVYWSAPGAMDHFEVIYASRITSNCTLLIAIQASTNHLFITQYFITTRCAELYLDEVTETHPASIHTRELLNHTPLFIQNSRID